MDDVESNHEGRRILPGTGYPVGCKFTLQPIADFNDFRIGGADPSPPAGTFRDALFTLMAPPEPPEEVSQAPEDVPPAPEPVPRGPESLPPSYILDYMYGWAALKQWGRRTESWKGVGVSPQKPEYHSPPRQRHDRTLAIQKRQGGSSGNTGGDSGSNNAGDGGNCAGGGNDKMVEAHWLEDLTDSGTGDKRSRDAWDTMELLVQATPAYCEAIRARHRRVEHWVRNVVPTFRRTVTVPEC